MLVRDAIPPDADACAAIYAPYVEDTAITFELTPPSATDFADRITAAQRGHAWLVADVDSRVVGYAYGSEFKSRAAYRWACEVSVYVEAGARRTGAGRGLYAALLERLTERGYRTAVAGMTLPNDASAGLHAAFGFAEVGTYHRIGWKFDRWHDVQFLQRPLRDAPDPPTEPT